MKSAGKNMMSGIILLVTLSLTSSQKAKAQVNNFVGLDHVGMNVPDMDSAVSFFKNVMGFSPVTDGRACSIRMRKTKNEGGLKPPDSAKITHV